ncbi:MAG: hypothetical protein LBC97_02900 [Bifidobacteriaceae bacterium]|nr:hypothetical protein [Bifidobacteriaceae bacterium]
MSLSNLAALILLLVAAAMPGRAYGHYLLVLAPCHALVCGFLWRATVVFIARRRPAARTVLAIGLAVCVLAAGSLYVAFRLAHKSQFGFSSSGPEAGFQAEMADAIRSNTPNEEPIQVYGNASWIYLASDRLAATKYHYIPLKGEPPALRGEVLGLIEDARPRVIIDVDDRLKATGFDLLQYSLVYQQVDNGLPMTYRVYALPQEIPSQG